MGDGSRFAIQARNFTRDAIAGFLASIVIIANIISFATLMFPGALGAGVPAAVFAMMIGSCLGGLVIAFGTSIPPIASGIDSPTGAVLILLSTAVATSAAAAGSDADAAIQAAMLLFCLATVLSGLLFYGLGVLKLGSYFRFVPSSVVAGFLAATGWFLIIGGVRMTTGHTSLSALSAATAADTAKLFAAAAVLIILLGIRSLIRSPFAIPIALVAMWIAGAAILRGLGLFSPDHGWYAPPLGTLARWSPFEVSAASFKLAMTPGLLPELLAVAIVALISVVTKVSSLEVARHTAGDLDREFRVIGIGTLVSAPFGGIAANLQTGTSRLLEQAGGATRMSGFICALIVGAVGIANFDLRGLIPTAIIAGLVFYLGYTFIVEALWRLYSQRAYLDLLLALIILAICVQYGYLLGVLAGIVFACVLFAITYSRLGAVRRHVTRAQFGSYVDRSEAASEFLRQSGQAIQIYWLSGYVFFGSSEGVFERIRADIEAAAPQRVRYVIIDFSAVPGADSSAAISLSKLRSFCDQNQVALIFSSIRSVKPSLVGAVRGKGHQKPFASLNLALAWCEDQLLGEARLAVEENPPTFEQWLEGQLGEGLRLSDLTPYLERKDTAGSQLLYRQGDPADTVDLVASGSLTIDINTSTGAPLRVRRITTRTVVGEMGFFRNAQRSATVSSDGPATVFTVTRASFERMRRERPDVASAFYGFIIRVLADRIDAANRTIAALGS